MIPFTFEEAAIFLKFFYEIKSRLAGACFINRDYLNQNQDNCMDK